MANCKILTTGLTYTCTDKKELVGGFKQRFWVFNKADIDKTVGVKGITFDVAGYVTNMAFLATTGLVEFTGLKETLGMASGITRTEGGYSVYPVNFEFMAVDATPAQRGIIEALANADDLGAIVETTSGRFEVIGLDYGLTIGDSNEKNYGKLSTDNSARMLTLKSDGETALPKIFFTTDYSATLAAIELLAL